MVYYCERNAEGEIIAVGLVACLDAIPPGGEVCTEEERDAWVAAYRARVEAEAQMAEPTAMERLRSDVDYLAALQGVEL